VAAQAEAGVAGCAMIAAVAGGAAADWAEARRRFVSFADEIPPNPEWRDRYLRYAELFDARYESSRPLWELLDALDASG
jgi:xylulokinase